VRSGTFRVLRADTPPRTRTEAFRCLPNRHFILILFW
jgi:hypothetical protein